MIARWWRPAVLVLAGVIVGGALTGLVFVSTRGSAAPAPRPTPTAPHAAHRADCDPLALIQDLVVSGFSDRDWTLDMLDGVHGRAHADKDGTQIQVRVSCPEPPVQPSASA